MQFCITLVREYGRIGCWSVPANAGKTRRTLFQVK